MDVVCVVGRARIERRLDVSHGEAERVGSRHGAIGK